MKTFARLGLVLSVSAVLATIGAQQAYAASTPTFNQTINAGVLATDILDGSRNPVASPAVAMGAKSFSFDCQNGAAASTGTLGAAAQRLYITNPGGANNGWTLTMAATSGATALWQNSGATNSMDFNDPTSSGCTDGADTDTKGGQMTINPSTATLTTDCTSCTTANVTKGSSTSFNQGTTDSVTLMSASSAANQNWRGYLTGVGVSQNIPGEQPADSYTLNMTLTATAL